jgi:predicted acyl esterase
LDHQPALVGGRRCATGTSYDGTLAEALLRNRHPAVKAIAPRFSGWDVYTDIFLPGGIKVSGLLRQWSELTAALDRNKVGDYFGWRATLMIRGVQPVTDDLLKEAVAEHTTSTSKSCWAERCIATTPTRGAPT